MNRPVGVSIPQGQRQAAQDQTRGQPRRVLSLAKLETYGIQYTDDTGAVHSGLCHRMGDSIYIHPHDEQWSGGVKMAANWLTEEVQQRIAAQEQTVAVQAPSKPVVDVAPPKKQADQPVVDAGART